MHPAIAFTGLYGPSLASWLFANSDRLGDAFDELHLARCHQFHHLGRRRGRASKITATMHQRNALGLARSGGQSGA